MTRREHYQRAQALLAGMDRRVDGGHVPGPEGGWRTTLAQIHATLALAMPDVAGETQPEAPDPDVEPAHLKAALRELADQDSVESTRSCASFIWSRIFGEVMP